MIQTEDDLIENTQMPVLDFDTDSNFDSISKSELSNNNKDDSTTSSANQSNVVESDDHLPRVQIELDKLNYATESINNLELELEESKREYLQTMQNTEDQLSALEKKLGSCVEKSKPYYDSRIELNEAKEKYLKAKNRFETAQELYVAAKNMQMYAEESLENCSPSKQVGDQKKIHSETNYDKETLTKMLEIAQIKVNDTELSKQSSDIEQIEAFKVYEEKRLKVEDLEKNLKKSIEKSRKYFELKSNLYKELRFLFTKIEGLKSCLKEAKFTYQQSLRNLELINLEVHTQRKTMNLVNSSINTSNNDNNNNNNNNDNKQVKDDSYSKLISNSTSTLSSSSSSVSLTNPTKSSVKSIDHSDENDLKTLENENGLNEREQSEQEDFDIYFKDNIDKKAKKEIGLKSFSRSSTDKLNTSSHMTDDEIEHLKLDDKLKQYKENLDESKKTDEIILKVDIKKSVSIPSSPSQEHSQNRPQFRIPSLLNNLNKK